MNGAIAPLSTQMQHEKPKYRKAAARVGACPARKKVLNVVMGIMVSGRHHGPQAEEGGT
jgi:hypothetical protein